MSRIGLRLKNTAKINNICSSLSIILLVISIISSVSKSESTSAIDQIRLRLNENLLQTITGPIKRVKRRQQEIISIHGKEERDKEGVISYKDNSDDSFNGYCSDNKQSPQNEDPSFISLCFRATRLCINFSPCMATCGLAYFSTNFRSKIWYSLIVRSLSRSGPAFIKWGQWASTRPDMFPEDLCGALEMLHANAPKHSWRYTQEEVEHALGISSGELFEVFEEFDQSPIGKIEHVGKHKLINN